MPAPKEPPTSSQPLETLLFSETGPRYFGHRLKNREGTDCVWLIPCAGHLLDVLYIFSLTLLILLTTLWVNFTMFLDEKVREL